MAHNIGSAKICGNDLYTSAGIPSAPGADPRLGLSKASTTSFKDRGCIMRGNALRTFNGIGRVSVQSKHCFVVTPDR